MEPDQEDDYYSAMESELEEDLAKANKQIAELQKHLLAAHNLANSRKIDVNPVSKEEHEAVKKQLGEALENSKHLHNKVIELEKFNSEKYLSEKPSNNKKVGSNILRWFLLFPSIALIYVLVFILAAFITGDSPLTEQRRGFVLPMIIYISIANGIAVWGTVFLSGLILPMRNAGRIMAAVVCIILTIIAFIWAVSSGDPLWASVLCGIAISISTFIGLFAGFREAIY